MTLAVSSRRAKPSARRVASASVSNCGTSRTKATGPAVGRNRICAVWSTKPSPGSRASEVVDGRHCRLVAGRRPDAAVRRAEGRADGALRVATTPAGHGGSSPDCGDCNRSPRSTPRVAATPDRRRIQAVPGSSQVWRHHVSILDDVDRQRVSRARTRAFAAGGLQGFQRLKFARLILESPGARLRCFGPDSAPSATKLCTWFMRRVGLSQRSLPDALEPLACTRRGSGETTGRLPRLPAEQPDAATEPFGSAVPQSRASPPHWTGLSEMHEKSWRCAPTRRIARAFGVRSELHSRGVPARLVSRRRC